MPRAPKIAIVTMAHNEALFLPIWLRHHAGLLGSPRDCFVIDHGTTDGSTDHLPCSLLRLPPSPPDDPLRARAISRIVAGLLEWYDWVAYCDTDELLLPDPRRWRGFADFCAEQTAPTITPVGLDIQHVPHLEPGFDPGLAVGAQRRFARFTSSMCKPLLTRAPVVWSPGFHCASSPEAVPLMPAFSGLYLFHLHWFDHAIGMAKLARTRVLDWRDPHAGSHQRLDDSGWESLFGGMAALPVEPAGALLDDAPPIAPWLERVRVDAARPGQRTYQFALDINAPVLWEIPAALRAAIGPV